MGKKPRKPCCKVRSIGIDQSSPWTRDLRISYGVVMQTEVPYCLIKPVIDRKCERPKPNG